MKPHDKFPPDHVADLDQRSAGAFLALERRMPEAPIVLFLGSGASASAGLPTWRALLERVSSAFFYHWKAGQDAGAWIEDPPKEISIAFWDAWRSRPNAALASQFAAGDPLLVAQQIRNCIRDRDWRYLLDKLLYEIDEKESALLDNLARLCAARSVQAIVNYNYDSMLEVYLARHDVPWSIVYSSEHAAKAHTLPVFHPHGYLRRGGGPKTPLIVSEDDYYQHSTTPYAWANVIQLGLLTRHTCVFVGMSMIDPNVRRLLRASRGSSASPHFAFLPAPLPQEKRDAMYVTLFDTDLKKLGVRPIRYPRTGSEDHSRLTSLLGSLGPPTDTAGRAR